MESNPSRLHVSSRLSTDSAFEDSSKFAFADLTYENDDEFPFSDQELSDSECGFSSINSTCASSTTDKDTTLRPRRGSFSFKSSSLPRRFNPYNEKRMTKWIHKHFSTYPVKLKERHYKRLRKICSHGIPEGSREQIWYLLVSRLSTAPLIASNRKSLLPENVSAFDDHLSLLCKSYSTVNPNPKWSDLILKDLRRCIADDDNFNHANGAGYKALNKVLFAFSVHNADVGYCQGLGPLVAFILNVFNSDKSIEDWKWEHTFWIVHFLNCDNRYMRDYNTPGLEGVIVDLWLFGQMVKKFLPKQNKILEMFGFEPTLYAQAWFFCLFVRTLPLDLCVRIWDMYICEGKFVMFKTALLILYIVCHKNKQLIKNEEMEEFLQALQHPDAKWFKTERFVEKLVKFRIETRHKRRFLEQAESFRYETFGAKHTITSHAPELRYENFEPISEVDSTENYFSDDCESDFGTFDRKKKTSDTLPTTARDSLIDEETITSLNGLMQVNVDVNISSSTNVQDAEPGKGKMEFGTYNRKISSGKSCDSSSHGHSPIALSACSSSTSEHKESSPTE